MSKALAEPLTPAQREEFQERDQRFTKNWRSMWEGIADLVVIQKSRLYREDFPSFEEYLRSRCNIGKAYAYQLIEAHSVHQKVVSFADRIPRASEITNERQCRELAKVPESQLLSVVEKAFELAGPAQALTAKLLKRAKSEVLGEPSAKIIDAVVVSSVPEPASPPKRSDPQAACPVSITSTNAGSSMSDESISIGQPGPTQFQTQESLKAILPVMLELLGDSEAQLEFLRRFIAQRWPSNRNPEYSLVPSTAPVQDPVHLAQKIFDHFDLDGRRQIFETISSLWNFETGGKKSKRKVFVRPTLEEVSRYCKERSSSVDPEEFLDHYAKTGWKLPNGLAVSDWQACVRTWERRNKQRQNLDTPKESRKLSGPMEPAAASKPKLRADLAAKLSQSQLHGQPTKDPSL